MTDNRQTKASRLRALMRAGKWQRALALANSFGRLGPDDRVIRTAHDAAQHGQFYRQIGRDPDVLIAAGVDALLDRYLPEERGTHE